MNLVLMGLPVQEKERRLNHWKVRHSHISTRDMFRVAIKKERNLASKRSRTWIKGLCSRRSDDRHYPRTAKQRGLPERFLDGFPNGSASGSLGKILAGLNKKIDYVININVDPDVLVERLTGRRICKTCGSTYHLVFNPPAKEGICDKCGGELYQRSDDREDTVKNRLRVNLEQTKPLLDLYEAKGYLRTINGQQDIDKVFADIDSLLGGLSE